MEVKGLRATLDAEGFPDLSAITGKEIYGVVRLWAVETGEPTLDFLIVSEEELTFTDSITLSADDEAMLVGFITQQLESRGVLLSDYGSNIGKTFHIDGHVPQALMDAY